MTTRLALSLTLLLTACDPNVVIGDPDGGRGDGGLPDAGPSDAGTDAGTQDVCQQLGAATLTFHAGSNVCQGMNNTVTRDPTFPDRCSAGLTSCTAADQQVLTTAASCLTAGAHCTTGNEDAAVASFMSCMGAALPALSRPCYGALTRIRVSGKLVFATSASFDGNLGGLAGADAKCQAAASTSGLTGTFKAWLSTSTVDAIDRIAEVGPWFDTAGQQLFATKANLAAGPMTMGLWHDEYGVWMATSDLWTGTGYMGRFQEALIGTTPCEEWTSNSMQRQARVGQLGRTGLPWSSFSNTTCDQQAKLICLQQ
ncbi:MAG: hypothetical protein U0228_22770 [Myxococcaceae bacterium]